MLMFSCDLLNSTLQCDVLCGVSHRCCVYHPALLSCPALCSAELCNVVVLGCVGSPLAHTLQRSHHRLQPLVGSMVLALNEEYVDMAGTHALAVKDGDTLAVC
jgi:hypothetical protein